MAQYSPDFRASNELDAKNMFLQRQYYERQTSYLFERFTDTPNFIDLWYETPFYGKVDSNGALILADQRRLNYGGQGEAILLNFVADAFADFRSYMNRGRRRGKTSLSNALFGNFAPQKTYESPMVPYLKHALAVMSRFNQTLIGSKKIVVNMKSYIKEFVKYFEKQSGSFTFSHFFASSKIGINASGLAIDLVNLEAGKDFHKNAIFKDKEFYFYVQAAANFGFRIDKNVPWRLIADLSSSRMQQYLLKHNFRTPGQMLQRYFTPTMFYDVYTMLVLLNYGYQHYQTTRLYEYETFHCFKADERFRAAIISDVTSQMKRVDIEKMSYSKFLGQYYRADFIYTLEKIKRIETRGMALPNYNVFMKKLKDALGTRPDRSSVGTSRAALGIVADYYNPAKIYTAGTSKAPYYYKKAKITPQEEKNLLTYKETVGTLYKTQVSIPSDVDLDYNAYLKND